MNNSEHVAPLRALLVEIIENKSSRLQRLNEFQRRVFDASGNIGSEPEEEIIRDLAYDLDFYESDPKVRLEDPGFCGDDRLEEEIKSALRKLQDLGPTGREIPER